ncbi:MAG: hypothetical protein LBP92_04720 [Deltaproteobacteria bacterium]|jgi:hypothetical protein|nr:hypothetical protein [Deltaproteobacteria bacterium]
MKFYNFSEAKQNFSTVLNTALSDEVINIGNDGSKFKLISIDSAKEGQKSPLEDIEGVNNHQLKLVASTMATKVAFERLKPLRRTTSTTTG